MSDKRELDSVWAVIERYSPPPREEQYWARGDDPDGVVVVELFDSEQTAKQWIDRFHPDSSAYSVQKILIHRSLKTARTW
jgi:hypothetical protein